VKAIKPSARGELEITEAIQYLIDEKYKVHSHIIEGYWKDTGRLEDMLEANRIVLDGMPRCIDGDVDSASEIIGKVHIQPGAKIVNSVVRGPAIIGENTLVENAYIGPFTSIYHDCEIVCSEVEHSIILEGSKILNLGVRIEDSLIGKNVKVGKSEKKPLAYRFMLGDNSEVSII
jgi:glucose-1-phosphate thymidylyltransferase